VDFVIDSNHYSSSGTGSTGDTGGNGGTGGNANQGDYTNRCRHPLYERHQVKNVT
jgi:hypothetical protein